MCEDSMKHAGWLTIENTLTFCYVTHIFLLDKEELTM